MTKQLCKLLLLLFAIAGIAAMPTPMQASTKAADAVNKLLDRIGGAGTAERFSIQIDASLADNGKDVFVLSSDGSKPLIKGSSTIAVTTGINWYLNHVAHVNLAWNNLTTDLSAVSLPLPQGEERHVCSADYRYYLNYCTFSYSMSTWTWERWQKEIDWMALHGINMPLQIVGLDVVWYNLLTKDLGYTADEAGKFVAGPCFQAWWGMNNLEGWGGPNPEWWYKRQADLCSKILARQRELGMEPVLPGYAGMVPSDIEKKGYSAKNQGNWCAFVRPYILDPNSKAFDEISEKYYARLKEVMGQSEYYSMDPFHEGANTSGIDVPSAYKKIADAMFKANADAKWVIQFWQWGGAQYNVLDKVEKGKLIVLDLYSDAHTHFGEYRGHDAVYCILPNFGGRTGTFGRLSKVMTDYYNQRSQYPNIKGVGATPEAIEQVPVLYDALFELPWRQTAPDPKKWVADYTLSRYGKQNTEAQTAWEKLRQTVLNCPTALQGPQEAVVCARPSLTVGSVSVWGGTDIFYDAQQVADAAFNLLSAKGELSGENYNYDLTDVTRQTLTDYSYYLLKAINEAHSRGDKTAYAQRRDAFLGLFPDLDNLLGTNKLFMLGHWTQMARAIADETDRTTAADRDWLELDNARTLISTWGARDNAEAGGLRDYSYRQWNGMLVDYYLPRWQKFFANLDAGTSQPDWFTMDWNWAHTSGKEYSDTPSGNSAEVATELLGKYFVNIAISDTSTYHLYRYFNTDAAGDMEIPAYRGAAFKFPVESVPAGLKEDNANISIDLNHDGAFSANEKFNGLTANIPADALIGKTVAEFSLTDGTSLSFTLVIKDEIKAPRTVSAKSADDAQGSVSIEGTEGNSIESDKEVVLTATPAAGYDFYQWTNSKGQSVGNENPYTYYGAEAEEFTAHFLVSKWGAPAEDLVDMATIESYEQYVANIAASTNGAKEQTIYSTAKCPESLFHTTQVVNAAAGSQLTLHWTDTEANNGLSYCRLSAYADMNADGDFDDEGEFLSVVGNKSSNNNTQLCDYTLKVLLPYEVPQGITHIRLRFDSSWKDGLDSKTDAMPAKAKTARMVYDIPVNVTEYASSACTVTVKSSNTAQGTVDASGQSDTYTYAPGEEVVLRAYPSKGYKLDCWKDQYGRKVPAAWQSGNTIRLQAPESGTYTAFFVIDPTSGINGVSANAEAEGRWFDIQGRPTTKEAKGIRISETGEKAMGK